MEELLLLNLGINKIETVSNGLGNLSKFQVLDVKRNMLK